MDYINKKRTSHAFMTKRFETLDSCRGIAALFVVLFHMHFADSITELAILAFSTLILTLAHEKGLFSKILKHKIFLFIGKLSYSIYMIHAAILLITTSILLVIERKTGLFSIQLEAGNKVFDLGSSFINNIFVVLILIGTVALSTFTYKFVELKRQSLGTIF